MATDDDGDDGDDDDVVITTVLILSKIISYYRISGAQHLNNHPFKSFPIRHEF